jgi:hypothetical protein
LEVVDFGGTYFPIKPADNKFFNIFLKKSVILN